MKRVIILGFTLLLLGIIVTGFTTIPFGNQAQLDRRSSLPIETYAETRSQSVSEPDNLDYVPRTLPDYLVNASSDAVLCQDKDCQEIIVGIKRACEDTYERIRALVVESNGKIINTISNGHKPRVLVADIPLEAVSSLKWRLLNDGLASYVEPNVRFKTAAVPNDPEWTLNWGLRKIEADYAWNTTVGQPSTIIAIVDTGVDWRHADLAGNIWNNTDERLDGIDNDGNGFIDDVRGWDFVDTFAEVWPGEDGTVRDDDPMDFYGHGTHCAGIAAAVGSNSIGICGVTWNCRIMPLRAGYKDSEGEGSLEIDDVAAAIIYAADNGADIISCSWGEYYDSQTIHQAVRYAYDAGALIVAAAGNEMTDLKLYPAAYDEVMAISATNNEDGSAFFTNFGDWIELAAPGIDIYSTVPDNAYGLSSGTSMSTPFVAGVAALVLGKFPNMNRDQVREQLRFASDDLGDRGFDVLFGYGRVNARTSVELGQESHDVAAFEINAASTVLLNPSPYVDVSLINMGRTNEHDLGVQFLVNDTLVISENVPSLASGELKHVSLLWDTAGYPEGHYDLTAHVIPVNGENRTKNNFVSRRIFARQPRILRVPYDYVDIQKAVDAASEGDTIRVSQGFYSGPYIYKDSLKLIGESSASTILSGGGLSDVVRVCANNIEMRSFTVQNSRGGGTRMPPFGGILLYYCNNVNISDVLATRNEAGIFFHCSSNVTLRNCTMADNKFNFGIHGIEPSNFIHNIDESNTVQGECLHYLTNARNRTFSDLTGCITLVNSTGIRFENLQLTRNYAGLLCVSCRNITVDDSEASLNRIGVSILDSSSVTVQGLNITENYTGINVENSENATLKSNLICGPYISYYGVTFQNSKKCQVKFNVVRNNRVNLYLSHSDQNAITNNEIAKAERCGLHLASSNNNLLSENIVLNNIPSSIGYCVALNITTSFQNSIYHNGFINNTNDVLTQESLNFFDDGYPSGGNFWSNYTGADFYQGPFQNKTGADGIGDTPHVIDANNRDNYPLMKPLLMLGFEQKTLDATDWDEWFNCTIESPLLSSFGINASISFGEETIHITPEGQVFGDRNNNNIPDLLLRFNRYEIVDFAMCQTAKNSNSFKLFRGFALRITLTIAERMGGVTFEVKDTITVASSVSSTPI